MIASADRTVLRDLAKRVAEIADLPVMAERRRQWQRHNALGPGRPMILIFPEGSWRELLPDSALVCAEKQARAMEWQLRSRLHYHEHLDDDTVVEKEWVVQRVVRDTGWGLDPRRRPAPGELGAWAFDPVLKGPGDLKKMRFPEVSVDEAATAANLAEAQDLFGDLLDVKLKGIAHISFHLMQMYVMRRGLCEAMIDMADDPGLLHDAMALLAEGHRRLIEQYTDLNLWSLNNDSTYHSSGGVGYTDELPGPGFDPRRVRPCDLWASAEAQELAQVSPRMHEAFSLRYEKPLGNRYIFSWKPQPSHLVGRFDAEALRAYIGHTVEVARRQGCVLEMILKDTHTCENHPERFTEWTRIARKVVESAA